MNFTAARDSIDKFPPSEWKKAASIAAGIDDPWFRCQALSKAALLAPDSANKLKLIYAALASGAACSDPNRIVTVSSWPVKAFYKLGYRDEGDKAAIGLLEQVLTEPSPVRRADALHYLLGATFGGSISIFWRVFDEFTSACTSKLDSGKKNSKGEGLLAQWVGPIFQLDHERGESLLALIDGPDHKRRAMRFRDLVKDKAITEFVSWPNL